MDFDDGFTQADYERIQQQRAAMLEAHHRAVEDFYEQRTLDEEDSFPYRGALTGDYYLEGRELYRFDDDGSVLVSIMARCLGHRQQEGRKRKRGQPTDYLGIDVVLKFDPKSGTFSTYYYGGQVI